MTVNPLRCLEEIKPSLNDGQWRLHAVTERNSGKTPEHINVIRSDDREGRGPFSGRPALARLCITARLEEHGRDAPSHLMSLSTPLTLSTSWHSWARLPVAGVPGLAQVTWAVTVSFAAILMGVTQW